MGVGNGHESVFLILLLLILSQSYHWEIAESFLCSFLVARTTINGGWEAKSRSVGIVCQNLFEQKIHDQNQKKFLSTTEGEKCLSTTSLAVDTESNATIIQPHQVFFPAHQLTALQN